MAGINPEAGPPGGADVEPPSSLLRHALPVLVALLLLVAAAALITYGITVRHQAADANTRTDGMRTLTARSDQRAKTSSRTLTSMIASHSALSTAISGAGDALEKNVQAQIDLTTAGNNAVDQYNAGNVAASTQTVRTAMTSAADTFDSSLRDFQSALARAGVSLAKLEVGSGAKP